MLQSMESQIVRHDLVTELQQQLISYIIKVLLVFFCLFVSFSSFMDIVYDFRNGF